MPPFTVLWHQIGGRNFKIQVMKKERTKNLPQDSDRHLDVPAEANLDRQHNYLADEEADENGNDRHLTDRQKEWKEGIREGREARDNS